MHLHLGSDIEEGGTLEIGVVVLSHHYVEMHLHLIPGMWGRWADLKTEATDVGGATGEWGSRSHRPTPPMVVTHS
jgi:hypothetical protein